MTYFSLNPQYHKLAHWLIGYFNSVKEQYPDLRAPNLDDFTLEPDSVTSRISLGLNIYSKSDGKFQGKYLSTEPMPKDETYIILKILHALDLVISEDGEPDESRLGPYEYQELKVLFSPTQIKFASYAACDEEWEEGIPLGVMGSDNAYNDDEERLC